MKRKNEDNPNIVNDDKYNVEIANDFTIDEIPENVVESNKEEITGYTAGLITKDLVSKGEAMLKQKYRNKNR